MVGRMDNGTGLRKGRSRALSRLANFMNRASNPRRATICAGLILASTTFGVNLRAEPATAPIREVVLFSSGVGYFQHEGKVQGNAEAELHFKTGQINDVLKSLVLQDLDGGRAGVVTYPSQDPLEKTLGSFQVDLSDNPSLGDLLNKLRGARITVGYSGANGAENFPGTILGVEKRAEPGGKEGDAPVERSWINLVTDKGIRSLELEKIGALKLEDAGLQDELNRALAAVAGARDRDKKAVDLRFDGQGERRVRIGYVVETPVWKASYRLVFGDGPGATLQGWAIVENQTDNDWKDVRLSLVSGRPISFIEDLYQPRYVPRPTVAPERYASLQPQQYDEGARDLDGPSPVNAKASAGSLGVARSLMMRAAPAPAPASPPMNPAESVAPLGAAGAVGELFQYTVPGVSLTRQRSAMIPILNEAFDVQKVSVFNQSVLDKHPLNGARLRNNSPARINLLQGPVTVYDDGGYAGDARLDDVSPGQERLLTYGVDLQTLVLVKELASQQTVQSGRIVKGVLLVSRKSVSAREYNAESKADHDKRLIIEHPIRPGWKLADTPKPAETTEKVYRFEEAIAPGKSAKLTVKEENVIGQQVSLLGLNADDVLSYGRMGEISAPVRDALGKAAGLKQTVTETQRQMADRDAQTQAITAEQGRIRENLKTVDRSGAYATRLLKKLDEQESQLDKLRGETDALHGKLDGQQSALADYLDGLNVE